jgi:hypothetical protein
MSTEVIQLEILRTLVQAEGHPLQQDVLILQVQTRVRPRPANADVESGIQAMLQRALIISQPNEFAASNPFWLLDEKGQATATRLRL